MSGADALYREGLTLFKRGKLTEAVAVLERAVSQDGAHADALEALGVIYGRMDRLDEAISVMKRLAELEPQSIMAHTNLSIFYMRKGMKDEAEQEKALATVAAFSQPGAGAPPPPPSPEELGAERADDIEKFRKMLALDPDDAALRMSLGRRYVEAGLLEEAVRELERAVALQDDYSAAYEWLGRAYEAAGNMAKAMDVYIRGIDVAERNGDLTPMKVMEHRLKGLQGRRDGGRQG